MKIRLSQPQCYSAKGQKPNQEDTLFPPIGKATENTRVFLVCDGMGGHENGEVASTCVAETIGKMTADKPLCSAEDMRREFEQALHQAYCNLDKLDQSDSVRKMGTTLTFLAICTDGVLVAHIGDSRVYQLRPGKGVVFQTRDHSLVNDLIAAGELTEEDAKNFPQRNVITRAVQPHQEYPAKAAYHILTDVRKGDVFFLCCDGVLEQLDNNDLCKYLLNEKPLQERLATIRKECETRGTRDNNTAYLIEVADADGLRNSRGVDDAELKIIEDSTVASNHPAKSGRKRFLPLFVILSILVILFLATAFCLLSFDVKKVKVQDVPEAGQVQGTIQRHSK